MISFLVFSSREKRIAFVTVCIVAFALFYKLLAYPTFAKWSRLGKEVTVQRNQLFKLNRLLDMKEAVDNDFQVYRDAVLTSGSEEEDMAGFLRETENLSRPMPIEIIMVKTLPVANYGFYKRYGVQLEVEGDLISICNFLYSLETSPSLLKVKKIQLNAKGGNIARGSLRVSRICVIK